MSLLTASWPNEFSDLKKLDDLLQCPICYEYISTCMITSCSHNFCSVCIRKYLQYKTQCPTCSEETYGSDLRKNRPVDDIIAIYTRVKEHLLYKLRLINVTQSIKGSQTDPNLFATTPVKKEDSSWVKETPDNGKGKKSVVQKLFSEKKEEPKPLVIGGVTIPAIFQPHKSPKKNVITKKYETSACPVCKVDVPIKNINLHLDSCLATSDPEVKRPKPKVEKRDPIAKKLFNMMKDKELKKYLKDYGLNTNGDRKAMIWRLNRYIVLYNAECDCENPRPVLDLLKQVEREEREEKANPLFTQPKPKVVIDKNTDPEVIEKVNKEYIQVNKNHFNALIEAMKQRDGKNIKPLKPLNRIDSDEELTQVPPNDHQLPSTSKASEVDNASVYSQETIADSDSDEDMFEKSPVKVEADVHEAPKLIDWNKTKVKDEATEDGEKETTVNGEILHDEESNSYESVFDKSTRSDVSSVKTPLGKAHSLSARKKSKTPSTPANVTPSSRKMEKMIEDIFENGEDLTLNQSEEDSNSEKENEDVTDSEDESDVSIEFKTPVKNYDISPEISPMKTRSKRKGAPATDDKKLTRSARRKRAKRSVSPSY